VARPERRPRARHGWVSFAVIAVLWLVIILWRIRIRIRIEERALLAALDDKYRIYASHHERLVPLVW